MRRTHVVLIAVAVAALASRGTLFGAGPSFHPDATFKGSSLTGWHPVGAAGWRADNGEIVGTPQQPEIPARVLAHIAERRPGMVGRLPSVKFLSPVLPGESIRLNVEFTASAARFSGSRGDVRVFEGNLTFTDAESA